ncbi:MAG: hypothetical protein CEN89_50 [Candidatus Berkelbacteria bacterium Licking1014_7]|uniref:Uncharacterized protein n=1 Tax=Candidatus Berkelbacteria bacterium Licking1014_7 TaxID=2017147 RepID=A0A554LKX0_9BACT|nr:MAG: hypothetical protein CEN89_50 [Candidatus Berkelbacteria bacterium Licking1014_7]
MRILRMHRMINPDSAARPLPSDVRAKEDIGQVIPLRRRSFWSTEIHFSTILKMAAPVVAVMLSAIFIPMLFGWLPVFGRSMEPTLPLVGGYVHVDRKCNPHRLKINDIVLLKGKTLGYSVKRVSKIDTKQGLYVLGDNINQSLDSSFGADNSETIKDTYIPFSEFVGRATDIWSPHRAWRVRTAEGKFKNWLELQYIADQIKKVDPPWVVVETNNGVKVYQTPNRQCFVKASGEWRFSSLENQILVLGAKQKAARTEIDLITKETKTYIAPTLLTTTTVRAVVKRNEKGLIQQSFLVPFELSKKFKVRYKEYEYIVQGFGLPSIPEFGGKPGTQFCLLPPIQISCNTLEMEISPL